MLRVAVLVSAALLAQQAPPVQPAPPSPSKIIEKALGAIRKQQQASGAWGLDMPPAGLFHRDGMTGLVVYTLLSCDVPFGDPQVQKGAQFLLDGFPWDSQCPVYETSLQVLACAELIQRFDRSRTTVDEKLRERVAKRMQDGTDRLVGWQMEAGWNYGRKGERADNSNTQFALMALRAAHNAGGKVPALTWEKALTHLKAGQAKDGTWSYQSGYGVKDPGAPSDSMTAACLMGLVMSLASRMDVPDLVEVDQDPAVARGFEALSKLYEQRSDVNPYLLWSVERACLLVGRRKVGTRDWYADGTAALARVQKDDGCWDTSLGLADTCFAVLFLRKAYIPVVENRPREQSK